MLKLDRVVIGDHSGMLGMETNLHENKKAETGSGYVKLTSYGANDIFANLKYASYYISRSCYST